MNDVSWDLKSPVQSLHADIFLYQHVFGFLSSPVHYFLGIIKI